MCAALTFGCGSSEDGGGAAGGASGDGGVSGSGGVSGTGGDSGAAGTSGSAGAGGSAGAAGSPAGRFPLTHSAGERFLREASGKPFFFHGDTAWSLIAQLNVADTEKYLEDRREKGFTVVLVNLLEHEFADGAPANESGDPPFTTAGDYSTPNEAYFAHADWVIDTARDKGLLVLLTPSYLGYGGGSEGFYQEMKSNGVAKLEAYGHYLGKRYASKPNILWLHAGDYDPPQPELVEAIAKGIIAEDSIHLHTAHTSRNENASDVWGQSAWLDVDNIYTADETHGPATALYGSTNKPFFLIEAYYEGEHGMSEQALRYQAYGALLGGAMGHIFGNNPMWCLGASSCFPTTASPPTWQAQLDGRGSKDMAALAQALSPLDWQKLSPDAALVSQDSTNAIAASAADGSLALVYTRSLGSLQVDLSSFSGNVTVERVDPTNASAAALGGSPLAPTGQLSVTQDQHNATGRDDWLLRFVVAP